MKLGWKLSIPQVCIIIVLGLASYLVINASFEGMRDRYVHDIVETRFKRIASDIEVDSQQAVNISAIFAQLPEVTEAYGMALAGNINDASSPASQAAREKLRRDLAPMLNSYKQYAGDNLKLHFHLPNGRSLVRLWRDKQTRIDGKWVDISDDISTFRPTVMDVNKSGKPVQGIELGSGGIALRGVVPVTGPNGERLGSVEALQSFAPILATATETGQNEMLLYINADKLSIATDLQDPAKNPRIGNFVRVTAPKNPDFEKFITAELLNAGKTDRTFENHGSLALATMPITNYRGSQIGVLVCAMKTDTITLLADRAELVLILMLAGMAVAPFLALLLGLRLLVSRPLEVIKARLQEIAKGWGDLPATEQPAARMDEIGDLNSLFNIFRVKLNSVLEESAEYISMLNNVPDPIFMVDKDYRLLRANRATLDFLGVSEKELKNSFCHDKFHTSVCRTQSCPIEKAKRTGRQVESEIIELNHAGGIVSIKPFACALFNSQGEATGYVEIARVVTDLVDSERQVNEKLERIRSVNLATREAAEQLAESTAGLSGQFGDVRTAMDRQRHRLEATVSAMEHMNNSVQQVARNAAETADQSQAALDRASGGAKIVEESITAILRVNEQASSLRESMHTLGSQAESIGAVLNVISDIADQTNLLALNAAIEAARAGDAGRGFAVVADEVRKLAEKTMEATGEVEKAIGSIQQGARTSIRMVDETGAMVDNASELAARSGEALKSIVELTTASSERVRSIAAAAEEQSATSSEINAAIDEVSGMSQDVVGRMDASAKAVEEMSTLAARLDSLSQGT